MTSDNVQQAVDSMTVEERQRMHDYYFRKEDPPFPGMRVTFWFPKDENLHSIEVIGTVPRVGETVMISPFTLCADEGYDFGFRRCWVVKEVRYCVTVNTTLKQQLQGPHRMRAEVSVVQQRDYWFEFQLALRRFFSRSYWRRKRS